MNTTITFTCDGNGRCFYTECIDLKTIGTLEMQRATDIEFNAKTQRWEVRDANDNRLLFQNEFRQACVLWERETLQ